MKPNRAQLEYFTGMLFRPTLKKQKTNKLEVLLETIVIEVSEISFFVFCFFVGAGRGGS